MRACSDAANTMSVYLIDPSDISANIVIACAVLSVHARTASALSTMALPSSVREISFHLNNPLLLSATTINPGEKTFDVINPGSKDGKEVIAKCRVMGRSDAKNIIEASAAALPAWRDETTCLHRPNGAMKSRTIWKIWQQ